MIDLKFLRENPEIVKQNIKNKFPGSEITVSRRSDRVRCEGKSNTERGR